MLILFCKSVLDVACSLLSSFSYAALYLLIGSVFFRRATLVAVLTASVHLKCSETAKGDLPNTRFGGSYFASFRQSMPKKAVIPAEIRKRMS